ncbi:hypothetical protein CSKR_102928 [Clonorchis sinensis]|uniref:Uncharacterized protein n=1 Tax=Clonorchis sinensis TaxID=79923 RepID=A0A3R7CY09_CLOSI|nr:hypothetical protein CSKR_102928 [Clonorchis sinensis]
MTELKGKEGRDSWRTAYSGGSIIYGRYLCSTDGAMVPGSPQNQRQLLDREKHNHCSFLEAVSLSQKLSEGKDQRPFPSPELSVSTRALGLSLTSSQFGVRGICMHRHTPCLLAWLSQHQSWIAISTTSISLVVESEMSDRAWRKTKCQACTHHGVIGIKWCAPEGTTALDCGSPLRGPTGSTVDLQLIAARLRDANGYVESSYLPETVDGRHTTEGVDLHCLCGEHRLQIDRPNADTTDRHRFLCRTAFSLIELDNRTAQWRLFTGIQSGKGRSALGLNANLTPYISRLVASGSPDTRREKSVTVNRWAIRVCEPFLTRHSPGDGSIANSINMDVLGKHLTAFKLPPQRTLVQYLRYGNTLYTLLIRLLRTLRQVEHKVDGNSGTTCLPGEPQEGQTNS